MRLEDKVAIITGAGSGIGRGTALLFAREGAKVIVADRVPEGGKETVRQVRESGGEAIFIETDVSKANDAERMVRETLKAYGKIDILFNNAGVWEGQTIKVGDITEEIWDSVIDTNLKGVFLCSKYAVHEMIKTGGGVIINTSSCWGIAGCAGTAAYSATKGGVVQFTKSMALEYVSNNIRVNCICPGPIDTPMTESMGKDIIKWLVGQTPMKRQGRPEDIAQAALYLASDESSFVTGTALVVDGGLVAK